MVRLLQLWLEVRSRLWLVPTALVLGMVALALVLIEVDEYVGALEEDWPRLFGAGSEGSREMLGVVAGSMITVAGVTFSVTIGALSQAANLYTPRILRHLMRDRGDQLVIGVFVGVFACCLLVRRSIRGDEELRFVPLHRRAGRGRARPRGRGLSDLLHPPHRPVAPGDDDHHRHHERDAGGDSISCSRSAPATVTTRTTLPGPVMPGRPSPRTSAGTSRRSMPTGSCVSRGSATRSCASIARSAPSWSRAGRSRRSPGPRPRTSGHGRRSTGRSRSAPSGRWTRIPPSASSSSYDIAVKALSPRINDGPTAGTVIDYLPAVLARLAERRLDSSRDHDEGGRVRVLAPARRFEDFLAHAVDAIRRTSAEHVGVLSRLVDALATVGAAGHRPRMGAFERGARARLPPFRQGTLAAVAVTAIS